MAQKLQCSSRGVDVLTGRRDNKWKDNTIFKRDLQDKRNVLKFLKHKLKEKESTAYLESSRYDTEMLKDEIKSIQEEINVISQKIWGKKPEFSDDIQEDFK
ncbi:hypothetical protein OAK66_05270 [Candidatus Nitrosopelagicus sp.]|nr:hypothetical protein [Candidatus Nitrosopelagicus sp.]